MLVSYKTIGRNIRTARLESNLTQEQASEKLRISQLHFGRLERGERPPSLELLAQIAATFDVSLFALLNGCVVEDFAPAPPSNGAKSISSIVEQLANGCSNQSQRLMISLCREVAKSDKQPIKD